MLLHDAPRLVFDAIAHTLSPLAQSTITDALGAPKPKVLEAI